jgi:anti-sigma factor RsiW
VNEPVCSRLGDLLERRGRDLLSPAEERLLRAHLGACAACAAEALRTDPVLLFVRDAAAAPHPVLSVDERERLVGSVLAAAAASRAGRRLRRARPGVGLRIAASVLLAMSLVGVWASRGRTSASPSPDAAASVARSAPPSSRSEATPAVEEFGSAGAVVYQFPATVPGEPTVVFVVDRNADI